MGTRSSNNKDNTTIKGGTGITAGGDVSFDDVSGQVAIGKFINQFKIEHPDIEVLKELITFLDQRREDAFNKKIFTSYSPSTLPDYPSKLREFVTANRVEEITKGLIYLHDHRLLLVSGVGGVGKTTLARALVETRPANVPIPVWFNFSKKMDATLGDILEELAGYLNMPDIVRFKDEAREAGQDDINRLTDELHKREEIWVVFDNLETILDDQYFHDPGIDQLLTSLRDSTHPAKIIVTSRTVPVLKNGDTLVDVIAENKQELKGLELNFAVDYLRKNGLDGVEREQLEKLAKGVDGHPLALKLLVELVKEFGVSDTLNDLSLYQKDKVDTIKKARRLFDKLAGDEKELLERLSVYRQPESMTAINEMFTDTTSRDAVRKLINKSLLETDHEGNYWLHPLVQEFAYDDLENKIEVHNRASQYYLSLPLPEPRTNKEDVQSLIEAHHHACLAKDYDKAIKIIMDYNLESDLDRWGNYRVLVELFSGMLPKNPLKDKPLLCKMELHLAILGSLGKVYHSLGETQKAIEYYESILKYVQKSGAKIAESQWLGNLGNAYYFLGEAKRALEYFEKALKIAQKFGDKESEGIHLGSIGNIHRFQGNDEKALVYYEKALKIAKEVSDRRNEAQWLGNLGNIYRHFNEISKAIDYNNKALKISQEINNKQQEGEFLGNLGNAYSALGNNRKAIECYEKSLKIATEIEDRSNICVLLSNLGKFYFHIGEKKKSIEYSEKALKITQEIGDKQGECILFGNLGIFYADLDDIRKTIEYLEKGVKISQEIGDKRTEFNQTRNLFIAYTDLKEKEKAKEYFEKTLNIAQKFGYKL